MRSKVRNLNQLNTVSPYVHCQSTPAQMETTRPAQSVSANTPREHPQEMSLTISLSSQTKGLFERSSIPDSE